LRFCYKRDASSSQFPMHTLHHITALHVDRGHGTPAAALGRPRRELEMCLHMVHLPQGQGGAASEEIGKARGQAAQPEPHDIAVKVHRAVEILNQKTEVADFIHAWAWRY
jgi:hypothetical protein